MITFLPTICKAMRPQIPCVTQFEIIDTGLPRRSIMTRMMRKAMTLWASRKELDWLFGSLLRDSAHTIVLSSPHRDRLTQHHADVREKTVIIPPPPLIRLCQAPPQETRKRIRHLIGATDNDFVLIYWGYIYPGKGVETLLRAFRLASRKDPSMRLVLVGGKLEITDRPQHCGDYFEMVRQLPEELGIAERVLWTGGFRWDEDTGSQYLHAGDACVLPFDYGVTLNNSSLAAACAHGLPVISTELSKGRDEGLEHGRNIYLCPPRDAETLAESISLIREDGHLRERLRAGARDLARKWYRWETATHRLIGVLDSAVSGHQGFEPRVARTSPSTERSSDKDTTPAGTGNITSPNAIPPLVSVIVAVHNVDRYLPQCLDALVHQTLKNVEIVVVNDASTDRCAAIIDAYRSSHPNLKVITCDRNVGLASVRNIGLRAATAQYIAFADGDDWVDIRMCEVLYRRAIGDNAEVVIADATVFYDDSKRFGPFFDQHIRQKLDPRLRSTPFAHHSEPLVLLLEPVAWTKLYDRAFLQAHAIEFEEGMNSYEDICFHFSVLLKAKRISLLDEKLFFYRQNRPGQISGRTNRKIFEVFSVFDRIHENLTAWRAAADVWAMLTKVQIRQFHWLLKDRVQPHHKKEFLASAAGQLKSIPAEGLRSFVRQANAHELTVLLCIRNNWLYGYEKVASGRWSLLHLWSIVVREGVVHAVRRGRQVIQEGVRNRVASSVRRLLHKATHVESVAQAMKAVGEKLDSITTSQIQSSLQGEPLIEVCRIDDQVLLLSRPHASAVAESKRRIDNDYYLIRTAVCRDGDVIVDVGANIGVLSVYLAMKYPFVKVYAIEPDPTSYECLRKNVELNRLANVVVINMAISGNGAKRKLYLNSSPHGGATISPEMASSYHLLRTVEVETTTLEQLFEEYKISHCRLLKFTAPGAVEESLTGFFRSGAVDFLCGEAYLSDCSRVRLEAASWRIAQRHFWRMIDQPNRKTGRPWIHHVPMPSNTL
jgi:FkbM family methyltransferase